MKDYYMIFVIIIIFVSGYLGSGWLDSFVRKTRRARVKNEHPYYRWIHIGVESVDLLEDVATRLEGCSEGGSYLEVFVERENRDQIFRDLKEERLDFAILADEPEEMIPREYQTIRMIHKVHPQAEIRKNVIEPEEINASIFLVWSARMDPENVEYIRNVAAAN